MGFQAVLRLSFKAMCEFIIVLCLSLNPGKVTHKTCILTQLFLFVMRILHSINCPKMIIGQVGNIMVASLFLQRPLRNKLQATERFINHSSWFLFRSTHCKTEKQSIHNIKQLDLQSSIHSQALRSLPCVTVGAQKVHSNISTTLTTPVLEFSNFS